MASCQAHDSLAATCEVSPQHQQPIGVFRTSGVERPLDLGALPDLENQQLPPERLSRGLHLLHGGRAGAWIPEEGDPPQPRHRLSEQCEPLAGQRHIEVSQAGDVAARPREAGYQARAHGVARVPKHDWDGAGGGPGGEGGRITCGDDHIGLKANQFRRRLTELRLAPAPVAVLDDEVVALGVADGPGSCTGSGRCDHLPRLPEPSGRSRPGGSCCGRIAPLVGGRRS